MTSVGDLTLEGWIQYLDFFLGKSTTDFNKPADLATKIVVVQITKQIERTQTRLVMHGLIPYNNFDTSYYHPCWKTFIPCFTRTFNNIPHILTGTSLKLGIHWEIKNMIKEFKH